MSEPNLNARNTYGGRYKNVVDISRLVAKEPPLRPLNNVAAICEDFKWRFHDRDGRDMVVEYCREAKTMPSAIYRACDSRTKEGKTHNHQSRVPYDARQRLAARLVSEWTKSNGSRREIKAFNFDQLHDWVKRHSRIGIGPVTVYDVAVRIGAYLDVAPESVYLHAGARQGAELLLRERLPEGKVERLPRERFPEPLNELDADSIEDILCTYRALWPAIIGADELDKRTHLRKHI